MGIRSSMSGRPWVLLPLAASLAACPSFATAASSDQTLPGRFGRMFGNLPPFASPTPEVRSALLELGKPGGLLDAKDDLTASPAALILVPDLSRNNPNSPSHTAGLTFVGQFLDHDIEFKAVFADIERDMAKQRAALAARPKDAPLELTDASRRQ